MKVGDLVVFRPRDDPCFSQPPPHCVATVTREPSRYGDVRVKPACRCYMNWAGLTKTSFDYAYAARSEIELIWSADV